MNDDRSHPATKGDLLDLEERIDKKFDGKLQDLKDELIEAIRDNQTEVLKAFYGFSQTV
jgi:hypothetical protein